MKYSYIDKFYTDYKKELLKEQGLRPAKSITRTITTCVPKFTDWYLKNRDSRISKDTIATEILHLTETGQSTIEDNIRNMKELQFLTKIDSNMFLFTRQFINFLNSKKDLEEYILNDIKKIDGIDKITMFYNYIICTLREGYINGQIVLYPDNRNDFQNAVKSKVERVKILKKIKELYGFSGRGSSPQNDDYTPNVTYRIISTCVGLGLVEKNHMINIILKLLF